MTKKNKRTDSLYDFKRREGVWYLHRGTTIGMGKSKGQALINLLNKLKRAEEEANESDRKLLINKKPE